MFEEGSCYGQIPSDTVIKLYFRGFIGLVFYFDLILGLFFKLSWPQWLFTEYQSLHCSFVKSAFNLSLDLSNSHVVLC